MKLPQRSKRKISRIRSVIKRARLGELGSAMFDQIKGGFSPSCVITNYKIRKHKS